MRRSIPFKIIAITIVLLVVSCQGRKKEYHNIIDKIKAHSAENSRDSIEEQTLYSMNELVSIDENDIHFYIKKRKGSIKSYACSECHNKPVEQLQKEGLGKKAHWDIVINHADTKTMKCASCHNGEDMNNLKSITGDPIDFDHSYKLCGQCHIKQQKDWIGGAHGKNISGWKSARVSKLCVECHNPHQPQIESRWPSRYNTVMVEERK
ncbi:cytochrome c3 family protein [Lutimonas zeaxanthinifaciens]|uniref:cytochrome c3 family protein n=1 Tax=Lutimonas zeaxanthinifaciens TaxID=3060215 RepID=UPI00265CC620|nr:cytochrome c3 family protein [Lutimonas sp. YSD2104]WKK65233.1 cytochrome c3 family protein [Lutimonas sp. YSD2104]